MNPALKPTRNLLSRSCQHEPELKASLAAGQWPTAAPSELRAHVAVCRPCSDLALLTSAFQAERASAAHSAQLPPPGVLWWRAQLRRRNAAIERINRPIFGAQLFAFGTALAAVIGFLFFLPRNLQTSLHTAPLWNAPSTTEWLGISWNLAWVLPSAALLILAGGIAVYMASERS